MLAMNTNIEKLAMNTNIEKQEVEQQNKKQKNIYYPLRP